MSISTPLKTRSGEYDQVIPQSQINPRKRHGKYSSRILGDVNILERSVFNNATGFR